MNQKVLILGSYGNFGHRISFALVKAGINIIIAGRKKAQIDELKVTIKIKYPNAEVETAIFDINNELGKLSKLRPKVIINTCGPFQISDYSVAMACIKEGIHYIDLADSRSFVNGITTLDEYARKNDTLIISGASTVPGLSSAVLEHYKKEFLKIESFTFGITIGSKVQRGLATTKSILSYLGKQLQPYPGYAKSYGWQDVYCQDYPKIGKRWMANCDVPDLDLLPKYYGIERIKFSAGMESSILHLGIWCMSWLIRLGIPIKLDKYAKSLLYVSHWFDWLGTASSGMHILIKGKDTLGNEKEIKWFLIAKNGDGPETPCVPAVLLAKKLINGNINKHGAMPCIGLITLEEYMQALQEFSIEQYEIAT